MWKNVPLFRVDGILKKEKMAVVGFICRSDGGLFMEDSVSERLCPFRFVDKGRLRPWGGPYVFSFKDDS